MEKDVEDYMRETFQIDNKKGRDPVSILDILDTMIAPDVDASVAANGVRQNALACQEEASTQKSTSLGSRKKRQDNACSCPNFAPFGNNCFYFSSSKTNYADAELACEAKGAQLTAIKNKVEEEFILSIMSAWSLGCPKKTKSIFFGTSFTPVVFIG